MLLNARVDPRTEARRRGSLRLSVDPSRFHFFDRETGAALLDYAVQSPEPHAVAS